MRLLASHFITISPPFDGGNPHVIYLSRLIVFKGVTYVSTVIALHGRDEFNLVVLYVKFEPENVEVPLIVLYSSALVDGRLLKLATARLLSDSVAVPKFVMDELHEFSASEAAEEKNRGERGLKTVRELRDTGHLDFKIVDSELSGNDGRYEKCFPSYLQ